MTRPPTIASIQRAVCDEFGVEMLDLLSSRRTRQVVRPRQIAMYLARRMTHRSMPTIGHMFGGRDHTTAIYAVTTVARLRKSDPAVDKAINAIIEKINAGNPETVTSSIDVGAYEDAYIAGFRAGMRQAKALGY